MFVLKRFISRDGDCEDETILIIAESPSSVRDKWNNHVAECKQRCGNGRNHPPLLPEDSWECSKSYSGGGCYAVFRYKVVEWEDRINNQ